MAVISINVNDALLHNFQRKMHLDDSTLKIKLESILVDMLTITDVGSKKTKSMDVEKIISGFQLKNRDIVVPSDEMGKGAVALEKYCR